MIATTLDQSKRLIKAGISLESADMCWCKALNKRMYLAIMGEVPFWEIEAWSLSALWELAKDLNLEYNTSEDKAEWIIEHIVTQLENLS